jgi:hypothetical protein
MQGGSRKHWGPTDPGRRETTDWEDILVKHDILQEDPAVKERRLALEQARQRGEVAAPTFQQRLMHARGDAEVDAMEDEAKDDDDEAVLTRLRQARIEHLKRDALLNRFGAVERIGRDEFMLQVKQCSATGGLDGSPLWVVIELLQDKLERSRAFGQVVDRLAKANPQTKCVRMVADHCIEHWPDSNVPAVFVYFNGELKTQLVGSGACRDVYAVLLGLGAIRTASAEDGDVRDDDRDVDEDAPSKSPGSRSTTADGRANLALRMQTLRRDRSDDEDED